VFPGVAVVPLTTIRHEMSRPSPVPSPTGLVVKNGSKIRLLELLGDARAGVADLDDDDVVVLPVRLDRQRAAPSIA
jgi:hypothetical protein